MPSLTNETREELLALLATPGGQAELEDPKNIFPVLEHARALEPEVALIVGDRGAGKTSLKRALEDSKVRNALIQRFPNVRLPSAKVEFRNGWPLGKKGPDQRAWRAFAANRSAQQATEVWLAYLVRQLVMVGDATVPIQRMSELSGLLSAEGVDAGACLDALGNLGPIPTATLDGLDERLVSEDRWIFVAYDELDTLVDNWAALGTVLRGLISFWTAYARRWKRIKPKLFLRTDFYKHNREVSGADLAKLAANRVELTWSDKNLYGALIKHILNRPGHGADGKLFEHFRRAVDFETDPVLGHLPRLSVARDAMPFVNRLVAEHMGASASKGRSFTWILDHLRDGNGRALPRSLIWLIEKAALRERDHPRAKGSHLLGHVSVRQALEDVSSEFVLQAETSELKWLPGLRERLKTSKEVPWARRHLLGLLKAGFDNSWGAGGANVRPPGLDSDGVLESLIDLGVVRERPDKNLDVPDLYLAGLGLTRRGGVQRE